MFGVESFKENIYSIFIIIVGKSTFKLVWGFEKWMKNICEISINILKKFAEQIKNYILMRYGKIQGKYFCKFK